MMFGINYIAQSRETFAQHSIKKEVFAELGFFTFYYKVCSGATNCSDEIFCEIAIHYTLRAYNDLITASAAPNGAIIYNVLSNDQYYGDCSSTGVVPATTSNVHITNVVNDGLFYTINTTTGAIEPGFPITSGTHLLSYTLCDNIYPSICQTTNVIITVPVTNRPSGGSNIDNKVFDIDEISISPNPTNDKIVVLFNAAIANDFKIELYDVVGRLLIEKQISKNSLQYELDLSNYSSANYFITLYDTINCAVFHKTIVKQ